MNRRKLLARIVEAGMNQREAAAAVGLKEATFRRKVNGLNEFKASEIAALSLKLGITNAEDIVEIFLSTASLN